MTLPYPHGSASGQIAHNSIYDTGYTPGSTGGKFIGFGEEGTSAIANRAHWALSANIDYLYQKVSSDKAIPAGASFTATGAPGQNMYQFADSVFSGDSTYPGTAGSSDPTGMLMLFAVLDANYNELTDGSGNEVRVKRIRESTGVTDVYKTGFVTNPRVYFCTVTSGGVEVDPAYQIPNGTAVRLLYGQQGTLENMPTDALIRFKVQSASEVEAGAFLQDGTKKMTGDADWDGHRLLNLLEARSPAGVVDLLVRSQNNLNLQGDVGISFKDGFLSAWTPLCESGQSALYQPNGASIHPSIIGAVNGSTGADQVMLGNRALNRTGSFTPTAAPALNYPALELLSNGQRITVPAGTVSFVGPDTYYVYWNPAAAAIQWQPQTYFPMNVPNGSIMLWRGSWNGAVWAATADLRWPSGKLGSRTAWFVGDGAGVDFTSLSDFSAYAQAYPIAEKYFQDNEIVIVGTATVDAYFGLQDSWIMRGSGGYRGVIKTSATFDPTIQVIGVGSNAEIRNIELRWENTSTDQTGTYAAGVYASINSRVINVKFTSWGSYKWKTCIMMGGWNNNVENCQFTKFISSAVTNMYYSGNAVRHCEFDPQDVASCCVDFRAQVSNPQNVGNVIELCTLISCPVDRTFWISSQTTVRNNFINQTSYLSSWPWAVEVEGMYGGTPGGGNVINNYIYNGKGIKSNINNATSVVHLNVVGNTFKNVGYYAFDLQNTAVAEESLFVIRDNLIDGVISSISYIMRASNCRQVVFNNNRVFNVNGNGITIDNNTWHEVSGNFFEGWVSGAWVFAIAGSNCTYGGLWKDNYFGSVGASVTYSILQVDCPRVRVMNNYFDGRGVITNGLNLRQGGAVVSGNTFAELARFGMLVDNTYANCEDNRISNNYFVNGINATTTVGTETEVDADCIRMLNGPINCLVDSNVFKSVAGRAIGIRGTADQIVVSNNTFRYIGGRNVRDTGGGTPSRSFCFAVSCEETPGASSAFPRRVTITDNQFGGIGYQWPNDHYYWVLAGAIYLDCTQSVVTGNAISQFYGSGVGESTVPSNVFDRYFGIYAGWIKNGIHVISGNQVRHMFGVYTDPHATFAGIYVSTDWGTAIVTSNLVNIAGTNAAPGGMYSTISGFDCGAKVTLGLNQVVGDFDNGNSGTDEAYACPYMDYPAVGNVSTDRDIRIGTWGTKCFAIGNLLTNVANSITVGTQPPGYTASPLSDFNKKL